MWQLICIEWVKTFRKIRTYLGFLAIGFFLPLVFVGIKLSGGELDAVQFRELSRLSDQFVIMGNLFNCFFVSQFMMMTFFVGIKTSWVPITLNNINYTDFRESQKGSVDRIQRYIWE